MRKNIASQQGIATLLLTAIILSLALIVALGTYKNLFYQIKRAQNQVEARQNYWLAEGGVECGIAQYAVLGAIPNSSQLVSDCDLDTHDLDVQIVQDENTLVFIAKKSYSTVRKAIITTAQVAAALQSTADLFLRGSVEFRPPAPTVLLPNNSWECAAVRFKRRLYTNSTTIVRQLSSEKPWADFPGGECAPEYIGERAVGFYAKSKKDLELQGVVKSINQDNDMNLFQELFGVPTSAYETIKESFHHLDGSIPSGGQAKVLDNCGTQIVDAIKSNYKDIWVEGGCQITEAEYQELVVESKNKANGVRVVVENGALSLMTQGSLTDSIKGLLFLFNHDGYKPQLADWDYFESTSIDGGDKKAKELLVGSTADTIFKQGEDENGNKHDFREHLAFFQNGRFETSGGVYIESVDASAIFNTSIVMRFNRDVITGGSDTGTFRMKKGSWYDR